ncbi:hypothetical protein BC938DRAFT_472090 [Jimgerdemannia flammicorona]|uniref:Uncharacterized protein n=1 Tax=Jimgerdemannia flammicorona TaxID=994334 RepID=A0A433QU61_9FUNG|nr:hypothetical protein BC938DRAFT_472090 [Jimgerdemannia flammicorona]
MVTPDQDNPDLWRTPPNRTPPLPVPNAPGPVGYGSRSHRSREQPDSSPEIIYGRSINSGAGDPADQEVSDLENPFIEQKPVCPAAPRKKARVKPRLTPGKTTYVNPQFPGEPAITYKPRLLWPGPPTPTPPAHATPHTPHTVSNDDENQYPIPATTSDTRSRACRRSTRTPDADPTMPPQPTTPSTSRTQRYATRMRKRPNDACVSPSPSESLAKAEGSTSAGRKHRKLATAPSPSPNQRRRCRSLSEDRVTTPVGTSPKRKTGEDTGSSVEGERLFETPKASARRIQKSPRTPSRDSAGGPRYGARGRATTPSAGNMPEATLELLGNPFVETGKGKGVVGRKAAAVVRDAAKEKFAIIL